MTPAKRILILCSNAFGERMSSPGIRARHMAEVLSAELPDARVTLAIPASNELPNTADLPYEIVTFSNRSLLRLLFAHDLVIATSFPLVAALAFPFRTFVLDYYTIYFIEWLGISRESGRTPARREAWIGGMRRRIGTELISADFMLTANDRQKDYYTGAMIALGLMDPLIYDDDPALHNLIEPAPHGIRPDALPAEGAPVIRGVIPGIEAGDRVLIWNGGIVEWYDPVTLLRALAIIRERRDDVKLLFVGGAYPGLGSVGLGSRFDEAIAAAKELGLFETHAFWVKDWVPYERMKDYMLEADLAVCTYFSGLETHFSFRTRFVDVFWSQLPLVCTEGDVLAEMVQEHELGIVVPERDPQAVASAILRILDDGALRERMRENIARNNERLSWSRSFEQLVRFCRKRESSALPKWRRTIMLAAAWAQWGMQRAATRWVK